jgi:hypothetical protein
MKQNIMPLDTEWEINIRNRTLQQWKNSTIQADVNLGFYPPSPIESTS